MVRVSADSAKNPAKEAKTKAAKNAPFYESWAFLIAFCIIAPILLRSFLYSPFHIPSKSMQPTLLVGDYIFVSKFSYGYSRFSFPLSPKIFSGRIFKTAPERGDVIVFRVPSDENVDYIKRLIGLPGDKIQMKKGRLFINGKIVEQRSAGVFKDEDKWGNTTSLKSYIETLPNGAEHMVLDQHENDPLDNTGVFTVPPEHYFFMGDNRDNSQDSRVKSAVGFVPEANLIGRAEMVFLSSENSFWKIWEWFSSLRTERIFIKIE